MRGRTTQGRRERSAAASRYAALSAVVTALVGACTPISCESEPSPVAPPEGRSAAEAHDTAARWAAAVLADLSPATPATEVSVRSGSISVDNEDFISTWPARALQRARRDPPSGHPRWPRLEVTLRGPLEQGHELPALREALEQARRAERQATGTGSGAGVYNLRVAADVPYQRVERVLYTASLAGYAHPRLLLRAGGTERMMPWPTSSADRAAPSREEIQAALARLSGSGAPASQRPGGHGGQGVEGEGGESSAVAPSAPAGGEDARAGADSALAPPAGARPQPTTPGQQPAAAEQAASRQAEDAETDADDPPPLPPAPRLRISETGIAAFLFGRLLAAGCAEPAAPSAAAARPTLPDEPDPETIGACLRAMRERADAPITLAVDRALPFGRLAPVLQHAARLYEHVRIVSPR